MKGAEIHRDRLSPTPTLAHPRRVNLPVRGEGNIGGRGKGRGKPFVSRGIVVETGLGHGKERRILVLLNEFLERLFRLVRLLGKAVNPRQI
jgi:hypothetical protein